jgi:Protein of unknown function (DUF3142)
VITPNPAGRKSLNFTGRLIVFATIAFVLVLPGCGAGSESTVKAADYDAYWLWAGVKPQPVLDKASQIYLHFGEVKANPAGQLQVMRPHAPQTSGTQIWLVVRAETLVWKPQSYRAIWAALDDWKARGNNLAGLQIDFDARTRNLQNYAEFLRDLRQRMPSPYRLSITGLLDWSANGDPAGLKALGRSVDEIVIQTYQGRKTIPGYEHYLAQLDRLDIPFKIGLVQSGNWHAPRSLAANSDFRGYVVFLVNPETGG